MDEQWDDPSAPHALESAWEPTNLIALWPGDQPPDCAQFGRIVDDVPSDDPRVLWSHAVENDDTGVAVLWAEPARAIGEDLDVAARACPWVLGMETVLDDTDPLESLMRWMRLLMDRVPDSPGLIDVNTSTWHPRTELLPQLKGDALEAPADLLWITHVVQSPQHGAWLHTHGLWRCGRPDLDMLDVPDTALGTAAELMSHAADLMLELQETPQPGQPFALGHNLQLMPHRWETIASARNTSAPGGTDHRRDAAHCGPRLVLCETDHSKGELCPWPRQAVTATTQGDAALFMTRRATRRQTDLAQRTWSDFLSALGAPVPQAQFLIKVALGGIDQDSIREHIWCRAQRADGERVHVELVNQPVTTGVDPSGPKVVVREDVTDWRVVTPTRTYAPETASALVRVSEVRQ
jgi:uncharacterized protein YegJ (DUF2314 family)